MTLNLKMDIESEFLLEKCFHELNDRVSAFRTLRYSIDSEIVSAWPWFYVSQFFSCIAGFLRTVYTRAAFASVDHVFSCSMRFSASVSLLWCFWASLVIDDSFSVVSFFKLSNFFFHIVHKNSSINDRRSNFISFLKPLICLLIISNPAWPLTWMSSFIRRGSHLRHHSCFVHSPLFDYQEFYKSLFCPPTPPLILSLNMS